MKQFIIDTVIGMVFGILFTLLLLEWVSGCGESYVDSVGQRHFNECLTNNLEDNGDVYEETIRASDE